MSYDDESFGDKFKRKFSADPFVPIGCALTAGILASGLGNFTKIGNRQNAIKSQKLMRARVMMQGITLGFLAWGTFMANMTKSEREEKIRTGELKRYNLAEAKD